MSNIVQKLIKNSSRSLSGASASLTRGSRTVDIQIPSIASKIMYSNYCDSDSNCNNSRSSSSSSFILSKRPSYLSGVRLTSTGGGVGSYFSNRFLVTNSTSTSTSNGAFMEAASINNQNIIVGGGSSNNSENNSNNNSTSSGSSNKPARKIREKVAALTLTEKAASRIKELMNESDTSNVGVKIGVRRRGCNGYSYTMNYANADDVVASSKAGGQYEVVDSHGVKVLVDNKAIFYLVGTVMDFEESPLASEFTFNNPNSKGECGCGESFNV